MTGAIVWLWRRRILSFVFQDCTSSLFMLRIFPSKSHLSFVMYCSSIPRAKDSKVLRGLRRSGANWVFFLVLFTVFSTLRKIHELFPQMKLYYPICILFSFEIGIDIVIWNENSMIKTIKKAEGWRNGKRNKGILGDGGTYLCTYEYTYCSQNYVIWTLWLSSFLTFELISNLAI